MSAFGLPASAFAPLWAGWAGLGPLAQSCPCRPQPRREADLRDRLLPDGLPFVQTSIGEEAGDFSGSVEERYASIMIFQHPDRGLGEVIAVPARRDLEDEAVISDRIVSPRDPFLVDA